VEVGFQHRRLKGVEELYTAELPWTETPFAARSAPGGFEAVVNGLSAAVPYEFRAVAKHPLATAAGEERPTPVIEKPKGRPTPEAR
jgi:hypothetical protein